MDILNLPEEMCANVLKYSNFETIIKCRCISNKLNLIAKKFSLSWIPVAAAHIRDDLILETEENTEPKSITAPVAKKRKKVQSPGERSETEERDTETRTLGILKITVIHANKNIALANRQREFTRRINDVKHKYETMDAVLKQLRCVNKAVVYTSNYTKELDDCLCQNINTFRNAKSVELQCFVLPTEKKDFRICENLKNLNRITVDNLDNMETHEIEEVLTNFDGDLIFNLGKDIVKPRNPLNLGDKFLHKWINKLPKQCCLTNYRNNFTLPVFIEILLALVKSDVRYAYYTFGILQNSNSERENMIVFLGENSIQYKQKLLEKWSYDFEIYIERTRTTICFSFDK